MKARDVIGRRIVAIGQERFTPRENESRQAISFNWISLDNGTVISFCAHESDDSPYVEATVTRKKNEVPT